MEKQTLNKRLFVSLFLVLLSLPVKICASWLRHRKDKPGYNVIKNINGNSMETILIRIHVTNHGALIFLKNDKTLTNCRCRQKDLSHRSQWGCHRDQQFITTCNQILQQVSAFFGGQSFKEYFIFTSIQCNVSFAESWLKLWEAKVRPLGTNNLFHSCFLPLNSLKQGLDYKRQSYFENFFA